jgi:hypothetical protein
LSYVYYPADREYSSSLEPWTIADLRNSAITLRNAGKGMGKDSIAGEGTVLAEEMIDGR